MSTPMRAQCEKVCQMFVRVCTNECCNGSLRRREGRTSHRIPICALLWLVILLSTASKADTLSIIATESDSARTDSTYVNTPGNLIGLFIGGTGPGSQAAIGPNSIGIFYSRGITPMVGGCLTAEVHGTQSLGNSRPGTYLDATVFLAEIGFSLTPAAGICLYGGIGPLHASTDYFSVENFENGSGSRYIRISDWITEAAIGIGYLWKVWFVEFRYRKGLSSIPIFAEWSINYFSMSLRGGVRFLF
jgi:hypothetical protein